MGPPSTAATLASDPVLNSRNKTPESASSRFPKRHQNIDNAHRRNAGENASDKGFSSASDIGQTEAPLVSWDAVLTTYLEKIGVV